MKKEMEKDRLLKWTSHHNRIRSFYSVLWKNTRNSIVGETKGTLLIEFPARSNPSAKINPRYESLPGFLYRDHDCCQLFAQGMSDKIM